MSSGPIVRRTALLARLGTVLLTLLLVGCGERAATPDELISAIIGCSAAAQAACDRTDVAAADAAAQRAVELTAELTALSQSATTPGIQASASGHLPTAQQAVAIAQESAALCREKKSRDDRINALSNWPYRKARPLAAKAVLSGLALAAGQAQAHGLSSLPGPVRNLAEHAAELADCPPLPDGSPDWPAICKKLDGWAASPPRGIAHLLAMGWLILDHPDMALIEVDLADLPPENPKASTAAVADGALSVSGASLAWRHISDDAKLLLLRSLIYRECELPRLAALDQARFDREFGGPASDPQAVAAGLEAKKMIDFLQMLLHGCRFGIAIKNGDFEGADREMAEMLRRGPDSPFAIMLTGERQIAAGQPDKSLLILETWLAENSKDPEFAWWVQIIQARARVVRDSAGTGQPVPPFLLDRDFLQAAADHLAVSKSSTAAISGGASAPEASVREVEQGIWLAGLLSLWLDAKSPSPPAENPAPAAPADSETGPGAEGDSMPADPVTPKNTPVPVEP